MPDKRDECGCHRECSWVPHSCNQPCIWPGCLTDAEHQALADAIERDLAGAEDG